MYSPFILWYLFLAGTGGGAYLLAAIFGAVRRFSKSEQIHHYTEIARGGYTIGPVLVAVSGIFLLFDLETPEKAYLVFLTVNPTILTIGSWLLVLMCVLSTLVFIIHHTSALKLPRFLVYTLEGLALLSSAGLITYTGVFASSLPTLPFLYSPFVVVIFLASSLSSGVAVLTLYGFFSSRHTSMAKSLRIIPAFDLVFILLEALGIAGLFITAGLSNNPVALESLWLFFRGNFALIFWIGVVALGMVLPICLSIFGNRTEQKAFLAIASLLLLLGAACLRYCLLKSGIHIDECYLFIL